MEAFLKSPLTQWGFAGVIGIAFLFLLKWLVTKLIPDMMSRQDAQLLQQRTDHKEQQIATLEVHRSVTTRLADSVQLHAEHLTKLGDKVDKVDDKVDKNRGKLDLMHETLKDIKHNSQDRSVG